MPRYIRSSQFKKSFRSLPKHVQDKAIKAFELFKKDPFHPSLRTKPIKGISGKRKIYEGYIDYYWRFTFEIIDDGFYFRNIGPHDITKSEL